MTIEEIKSLMSKELEEGEEDNRLDDVYSEIETRDGKITELETKVTELTNKVSELVGTNAKLAETIKYVEPEADEGEEEPEVEFADFSDIFKEEE